MRIELKKAVGCAWRGRYLKLNGRQIAHVSLDPTSERGPRLSGSFQPRLAGRVFKFRVSLPHIPWWAVADAKVHAPIYYPLVLALYRASSRFWHRLDGRYRYYSGAH